MRVASSMSLKLPHRFLHPTKAKRVYATYKAVPSDEGGAPTADSGITQSLWRCWDVVWSYRRRARDRKLADCLRVLEDAHEQMESQQVVAQQKLDECTALVLSTHKAKDVAARTRALRRQKRLRVTVRSLEDYVVDLERKIDMVNEFRTNHDVIDVVKNVGVAVSNVDADASLREAESSTDTLDDASEALHDLSQFMRDSAARGADDDDDALLLLELECTLATPPEELLDTTLTLGGLTALPGAEDTSGVSSDYSAESLPVVPRDHVTLSRAVQV